MAHKFVNFNQEKINTKRSSALTGEADASGDGPPTRWTGQGGARQGRALPSGAGSGGWHALLGGARPEQSGAGPGCRRALLGGVGRGAARTWRGRQALLGHAGRDRGRRSWRPACAAERGWVGVGTRRRRGSDGQASVKGGRARRARHAQSGRAWLRQEGPAVGARCVVGLDQGRAQPRQGRARSG
jgi:hypothetical protein